MSAAWDIREDEDCPDADACDNGCDQHTTTELANGADIEWDTISGPKETR